MIFVFVLFTVRICCWLLLLFTQESAVLFVTNADQKSFTISPDDFARYGHLTFRTNSDGRPDLTMS